MKYIITLVMCLFGATTMAQLPHDIIYMPKKTSCIALLYGHSSWTSYWENTLKRTNQNLATVTTQSFMPMAAIGIAKQTNLLIGVPYVSTKASAGNLMPQKGFQDASLWLKSQLIAKNGFSLHGVVGGSMPISRYVPDFLPLSIGLGAKSLTGRLIMGYQHTSGLYATTHGSYVWRGKINVDRDGYFANSKLYEAAEMSVPNAIDAAFRLGYMKDDGRIQVEAFAERFGCTSGDYIRRNDMPYPTNKMEQSSVGIYGKYHPKMVGVSTRVSQVLSGRNIGQATTYSVGLLIQFD